MMMLKENDFLISQGSATRRTVVILIQEWWGNVDIGVNKASWTILDGESESQGLVKFPDDADL